MRRGTSDSGMLFNDDKEFYGISLGWDFTAEHEWGIEGIQREFNIDSSKLGYKGRKIGKVGNIQYLQDDEMGVLTARRSYSFSSRKDNVYPKDILPHDIGFYSGDTEMAWSGEGFCVATKDPTHFKYLKEIYDQFQKKNIVIAFYKPSGVKGFGNSALSLLILDKLDQESKDAMYYVDKMEKDLEKYEKKIGVTKLKEKKGSYHEENYFMACSPRWINYEDEVEREKSKKKLNTKYNITFWVNYSDDDENYGLYIAEDIIKWLSTPGLKLKQISEGGSKRNNE